MAESWNLKQWHERASATSTGTMSIRSCVSENGRRVPFQSIKDKFPNRPIWSTPGSYMRRSMLKQLGRAIEDYDIDEQELEKGLFRRGCMRVLLRMR